MMYQTCPNTYSTIAVFRILQRLFRRTKLLCRRYAQWRQRIHDHEALLRMEDRMLKDIGLSRADVRRMGRDLNFWRHMLQSEVEDNESEPNRSEKAVCDVEPIQGHASSDLCLCSSDRSFSRN